MAERKVLSKYFPPDFDPSKIKRTKKDVTKQQVVRLMAPFSMMCSACGEYIYKGRKFNARKEVVMGEDYFGIKILRFYIKCTRCSAEITFKTDPKNTDYAMEHGATRNYQPWVDGEERRRKEEDPLAYLAEDELARQEAESGKGMGEGSSARTRAHDGEDPMASLEARQEESKREMAVLDELQDIRTRNAKMDRVHADDLLDRLDRKRKRQDLDSAETIEEMERRKAEEEDEILVRKYFSRQRKLDADADAEENSNGDKERMHTIKRVLDEKEPEPAQVLSERAAALVKETKTSSGSSTSAKAKASSPPQKDESPVTATDPAPLRPTAVQSTPAVAAAAPSSTPHSAKTAAMAGMAKKKKSKGNALGLVQKKVK